jgi:hypothetical protein
MKIMYGTVGIAAVYNAALFTHWKQSDNIFTFMGRVVASIPLQMIPHLKDAWGYIGEGHAPKSPQVNFIVSMWELGKDGWDWLYQNKRPKQVVRHAFNVAGQVAGVPGSVQAGRTIQGQVQQYYHDQPPPRNFGEWLGNIFWAQSRPQKR